MIDRDDPWHPRTVATLGEMSETTFVTTWACFTEAMHFLRRAGGLRAQEELWDLLEDGTLRLHASAAPEPLRMRRLMGRYGDAPMDLADASLVTAAETLGLHQIFTFDRHFYAFKHAGGHFDVVP
jgi:predicted nucleic acid-binding protein